MSSSAEREGFVFAHKTIDSDCVFWRTPLVYATVNLKPIVPGRALCAASTGVCVARRRPSRPTRASLCACVRRCAGDTSTPGEAIRRVDDR